MLFFSCPDFKKLLILVSEISHSQYENPEKITQKPNLYEKVDLLTYRNGSFNYAVV